jgi:hypothetical protein
LSALVVGEAIGESLRADDGKLMSKKKQLEFFVLRYMPDAIKEEFVNIGLVMIEPGVDGGFTDVRFARDWRRLHCVDPNADIEILEALEREIRKQLPVAEDRAALMKRLQDSFSNVIQISPLKACISEEPAQEIADLAKTYLESPHRSLGSTPSARQQIVRVMRNAFKDAGVLGLLHQDFAVEKYTRTGDPLKIDFAYPLNDIFKMFHGISLKTNVDQAVTLAYRFPKIAEGMLRTEKAQALLTVVVDDGLDLNEQDIAFAFGVLEENRVQVAFASEMPRIAENARVELRA